MPTANDLVTRAFRLIGVVDAVGSPSAEDAQAGLDTLNNWMDSLGTDRLSIFHLVRTVHTLSGSTASYTIGVGGTINIARPMWVQNASLILDSGAATPTEVPIQVFSDDEWAGVAQKTLSGSQPTGIWFDHAWTAGLGTVHIYPVPSGGTKQLVLYVPTALAEFADLTATTYTFPPGYERAIRFNLAVELAAEYPGSIVTPTVERIATTSLGSVKRANWREMSVPIDPALTGGFHRTGGSRTAFLRGT